MGRDYGQLHFDLWVNLRPVSGPSKLLYVRLIHERTRDQAGIAALRLDLWAKDIGVAVDVIEKSLRELEDSRHVYTDWEEQEVLVRAAIRRSGPADQPNLLHAACRQAVQVRSAKLRRVLAAELRRLPPRPPDKVYEKTGKVYVYPDPHATADEIDPGPPDDADGEPFPKGSRRVPEGFPDVPRSEDTRRVPEGFVKGSRACNESGKWDRFGNPSRRDAGRVGSCSCSGSGSCS